VAQVELTAILGRIVTIVSPKMGCDLVSSAASSGFVPSGNLRSGGIEGGGLAVGG